MAAPSMVSLSGDNLIVRSVVSGDALYGTEDKEEDFFNLFDQSNSEEDTGGELRQCAKRNYKCNQCDFFTQNPRFNLYHQKQFHNENIKIYECPDCLYASKHNQKLQRHIHMVHAVGAGRRKSSITIKPKAAVPGSPPKPHPSQPAPQDKFVETAMYSAMDGARIFKCSVCDMTSKSEALVARHEKLVHLKRRFYRCVKCNYVTHMKARFTKHVKYHSMPMIKCDMCDFKTPYKWNLDRHNKNHMGNGPFRCTICNFAADIKQSLTVHEMNHHIPPVGHINSTVNKRRLKVGASDSRSLATEEDHEQSELELLRLEREGAFEQIPADFVQTQLDSDGKSSDEMSQKFKTKRLNNCRLCDFTGDMAEIRKHESGFHRIQFISDMKKASRPIPNLIPIQGQSLLKSNSERKPQMSDENINNICSNSSLKDFAPLIGDEFNTGDNTDDNSSSPPLQEAEKKTPESFKKKNASFFDKLKEKLMTSASESNLTCSYCGHEAKCLSEHMKHQKTHMPDVDEQSENSVSSQYQSSELSSTRCQHCRHRCKSSSDLMAHLQMCSEVNNQTTNIKSEEEEEEYDGEDADMDSTVDQTHPMENKVFVWNSMADSLHGQDHYSATEEDEKSFKTQEKSFVGVELKPGYGTTTVNKEDTNSSFNAKKVFKCPHCTFWASTASRFHVHIVGHLNKRPFQCSLCYYSSNWRWDITKHIRLKSLRDASHESAKVLLTDETGRRNYAKYNQYLTTVHMETSTAKHLRMILPKGEDQSSQGHKRSSVDRDEDEAAVPKKKPHLDNKKTMWKCKKCCFRDGDKNIVLAHVKDHYRNASSEIQTRNQEQNQNQMDETMNPSPPQTDNEDSNNSCPDFMCETCPFICNSSSELEAHAEKHFVNQGGSKFKCQFCKFYAQDKEELMEHLDSHSDNEANEKAEGKHIVHACANCPYVGTSKAQLMYHRKGHLKDNPGEHKCHKCTYKAQNNLILALHVRLHSKHTVPIENKTYADISGVDTSDYPDIPMVWVSRPMGISKLFKCRFCPHINMRKSNIHDHEKMHPTSMSPNSISSLHACSECSYVSASAGLFSSHVKVHQGYYGQVVGIVDPSRTDNEQILEMKAKLGQNKEEQRPNTQQIEEIDNTEQAQDERNIHFCHVCPARFLFTKELSIHMKFHELKLPFRCNSCSYTARQMQHLLAHLKVHLDEYQGRTNVLVGMYEVSEENPRPKVAIVLNNEDKSESVWVVVGENSEVNYGQSKTKQRNFPCHKCPAEFFKSVSLNYHLTLHGGPGPHKCKICDYAVKTYGNLMRHEHIHQVGAKTAQTSKPFETVPTSGTELFRQKNEAVAAAQKTPPKQQIQAPLITDPEFGILIHGSPEFIYPTYYKNGKLKEKRYKCHKCPSAFEKREQYKIHLSLHGSKQRYNCERCDYSVKYYANYSQHMKKHDQNDASQKEKKHVEDKSEDTGEEMEVSELEHSPVQPVVFERSAKSLKMSVADQQTLMLMQQRNISKPVNEKEIVNRCPQCPYANNRKDGVHSHIRCHSDTRTGQYTCKYCNYNVPQLHFLREHLKVHFSSMKFLKPHAYMKVNKLEIWAEPLDSNHNLEKLLIFKDQGENYNSNERYLPKRETDFDSIKGRIYINLKTGEEEVELDDVDDKENEMFVKNNDTTSESIKDENKKEEDEPRDLENGLQEEDEPRDLENGLQEEDDEEYAEKMEMEDDKMEDDEEEKIEEEEECKVDDDEEGKVDEDEEEEKLDFEEEDEMEDEELQEGPQGDSEIIKENGISESKTDDKEVRSPSCNSESEDSCDSSISSSSSSH